MVREAERYFREVLQDHGAMISRIVSSYEFDSALQQDLVQEVALAIWQALPGFEGRSSIKTFVARIAHYRAVSHVAKEARTPKPSEPDQKAAGDSLSPEEHLGEKLKLDRLISAVRTLPLNLRQVATLALEGFEPREIAEALGITPNNASVRLNRAKNHLKKELSQ